MNIKNLAQLALALTATAGLALAQAPSKVGVINIQSAIVGTKEGQKAAQELEGRMSPKNKDLEKRRNDIRSLQENMQKGGSAMSETAKQALARDIDTKTKDYNRTLEDFQAEVQQEQDKLLGELGQKMMAVIDKYAKDNGFSLILDVSNPQTPVLYASNTIDITQAIIELYDKNAGTITPAAAPAKPATPPPAAVKPTAAPATKK